MLFRWVSGHQVIANKNTICISRLFAIRGRGPISITISHQIKMRRLEKGKTMLNSLLQPQWTLVSMDLNWQSLLTLKAMSRWNKVQYWRASTMLFVHRCVKTLKSIKLHLSSNSRTYFFYSNDWAPSGWQPQYLKNNLRYQAWKW